MARPKPVGAKESYYKVRFQLCGSFVDFLQASVTVDPEQESLTVESLESLRPAVLHGFNFSVASASQNG
jgi:4'-phosphopantetheinyl transferase EntD